MTDIQGPQKIAFIGKMFSGKTTAAEHLVKTKGYKKLAFADPVKHLSVEILNLVEREIGELDEDGTQVKWWDYAEIQQRKGENGVRKLLQLVGTELGRELVGGPDVWVDKMDRNVALSSNPLIVVDDCRFPNEAKALKELGFVIIRIRRPEDDRLTMLVEKYPDNWQDVMAHPSETSLDDFEANHTIDAKDLKQLYNRVNGLFVGFR